MDLRERAGAPGQRHPWEVARARFFSSIAQARLAGSGPLRVLDVGAGDGYLAGVLLARLPAGSTCLCVDPNYSDAHLSEFAQRAVAGVRFALDAPTESFDLVLMLDVLEHVADDLGMLSRYAGPSLRSGGGLLASVPAFMSLYSQHDAMLGHLRRYRLHQLCRLLERGGLRVSASGGLFHSLLPVRAVQVLAERARGRAVWPQTVPPAPVGDDAEAGPGAATALGDFRAGPLMSRFLLSALGLDNALSRWASAHNLSLPGLSAWAYADKP